MMGEVLDPSDGKYLDGGLYKESFKSLLSRKEIAQGEQYAIYRPIGENYYVKKPTRQLEGATKIVPTFWTPDLPNPDSFYTGGKVTWAHVHKPC